MKNKTSTILNKKKFFLDTIELLKYVQFLLKNEQKMKNKPNF